MRSFVARRLAVLAPSLLFTTLIVFLLRSLIPGGPEAALAGMNGGEQAMERIRADLQLDRPLLVQYLDWLGGLLRGDLGRSYLSRVDVSQIIGERLEPTLVIVGLSFVLATVLGVSAGIFVATRNGSRSGRLVFTASGIGLAVPPFWLAAVGAGYVGTTLGWLPTTGYVPFGEDPAESVRTLVMPVVVMAVPSTGLIARQVRAAMATAMTSTYVRTARAMGISRRRIVFELALRNAVGPVITFLPLVVAGLVGAAVVVESVFAIPGLGREIVRSVSNRDYATLQVIVLMLAVVVLVLNLLADVVLALLDPRVRKAQA